MVSNDEFITPLNWVGFSHRFVSNGELTDSQGGLILNPELGIDCKTNRECSRGQPYFSVFNAHTEGIEGQPPIATRVEVVCGGWDRSDII